MFSFDFFVILIPTEWTMFLLVHLRWCIPFTAYTIQAQTVLWVTRHGFCSGDTVSALKAVFFTNDVPVHCHT